MDTLFHTLLIIFSLRKVLEFVQPEEMKNRFNLKLEENATSNEELEKLAENVIKYSLKTGELMGIVWVAIRSLQQD